MPKTAGHDYEKIVKLACKPKNAPPKAKVRVVGSCALCCVLTPQYLE